jgi:2-polyprenyl-3-methyl-5-hydroxy-6-metoxy-1,4-benzoquinol methylase
MPKPDPYIKNAEEHAILWQESIEKYGPITLPAEYTHYIQDNALQLLVRLARYKFVAKNLKATDRVLEIGSGTGLGAQFLAQHCAFVKGIEFKQDEIARANAINRRSNIEFIQGDFFDLGTQEKFETIVNLDVIEHMPQDIGEKLIAKTTKHLSPNGMMIIGTPSIYSFPYQGRRSRAAHIKCYDQQELLKIVDRHYGRTIAFSMNDEVVHTGFSKLAWYYFIIAFYPKGRA